MVVDAEVMSDEKSAVPVKVGDCEKTTEPAVPVSSPIRDASSAEVSIEVEEILLLKVDQSMLESRPKGVVAVAVGMLSVWVDPLEVKPQPPAVEEVAKVWVVAVRPLSEVMPVPRQVPFTA